LGGQILDELVVAALAGSDGGSEDSGFTAEIQATEFV
jgi:hypothetical protein